MQSLSSIAVLVGLAGATVTGLIVTHPDAEDLARAEMPAPAPRPLISPLRTAIFSGWDLAIADGGVMHPDIPCPAPARGFNRLYAEVAHRHAPASPNGLGCEIHSLAERESNQNPDARSHAGAEGMVQIVKETAAEWGVDPFVPEQAVDFAARYLNWLADRFPHITHPPTLLKFVLAAYNWGVGNVKRTGCSTWACLEPLLPDETRVYVAGVLKMMTDGSWYREKL